MAKAADDVMKVLMSRRDRKRFGVRGRTAVAAGIKFELVDPGRAQDMAVLACLRWRDPPTEPDNLRCDCLGCGCALQHRPDVPRHMMPMCIPCSTAWARAN